MTRPPRDKTTLSRDGLRVSDLTRAESSHRDRTARRVLAALACEAAGVDVAAALAATGPDVPEDERRSSLAPLLPVAEQWVEVVDTLTASPRGAVGSCRCGCGGELSLADHGAASGYKSWCEVRVRRARSAPSD